MFGKSTPTEATDHDYVALARKYSAKAADAAEGVTGTNPKSVALAQLALTFATQALLEHTLAGAE